LMKVSLKRARILAETLLVLIASREASSSPIVIALQPFIDFDTTLIPELKEGITAVYGGASIVVLPQVDLPSSAYYKPRNRYRAEKLVAWLADTASPSPTKIVGLTSTDISTTKGKHADWGIFGLADINGRACVISTFRLGTGTGTRHTLIERLVKVVNHELGHTFGLFHCRSTGCLMEDARGTIRTVDRSDGEFCDRCTKLLEVILSSY